MKTETPHIEAYSCWISLLLLICLSACSKPETTRIFVKNTNFFYQEIHFLDNGTAISFLQNEGKLSQLKSKVKELNGEIVLSGSEHEFHYKHLHFKGQNVLVPDDVYANMMEQEPSHRDQYLEESFYFIPSESGKYSVR